MTITPRSLPELVVNFHRLPPLLNKLFEMRRLSAEAVLSPELFAKYKAPSCQEVIYVRNRHTEDVCVFNPNRSRKPQSFRRKAETLEKGNTDACDFCQYERGTAEDTFGRIEGKFVTTASNLFKYIAPYQAVAFLKQKHDLLDFSLAEFRDYLDVSARWFRAADADWRGKGGDDGALKPLIVWNGGERSGASQGHSHIQLLYSAYSFPDQARLEKVMREYNSLAGDYYADLVEAHSDIGLSHRLESAAIFVSLLPLKNRDMVVVGERGIEDEAFQTLLFCGLRTLIDELGSSSFNLGIYSGKAEVAGTSNELTDGRVIGRIVSRGQAGSTSVASDFGGLEVFAGASIGSDCPFTVKQALDRQLKKYV